MWKLKIITFVSWKKKFKKVKKFSHFIISYHKCLWFIEQSSTESNLNHEKRIMFKFNWQK
jgi:hypothetical protein